MATRSLSIACVVVFCLFATAVDAFSAQSPEKTKSAAASNGRRDVLRGVAGTMGAVLLSSNPQLASAASAKSRTDGYAVQRPEREWAYVLSGQQYNILREGGTERPYSSILEGEDRPGTLFVPVAERPCSSRQRNFTVAQAGRRLPPPWTVWK